MASDPYDPTPTVDEKAENRADKTAGRSYKPVIAVMVCLLLILLTTAGFKSWRELSAAHAHEAELEREIAATEERIHVLREHVRAVKEDPLTLERMAREGLGMVRPGDVVIVLPEPRSLPKNP